MVLAAGVAQADITFSGSTGVALIDDNGASILASTLAAQNAAATAAAGSAVAATATTAGNNVTRATRDDMFFESYYDFNVTASAESDNGVSVSVGFDMGAGNMIDYNDDDKLEAQGNNVGDADVSVGYAGWTLAVDNNGIADLYDGDIENADASLSGTIAGWAVAVTTDQDKSKSSYSVSGAVAGVTLTATGSNDDSVHATGNGTGSASKLAASYAMGDLTLSASVANEAGTTEDDSTLGLSYVMGDITVGYTTIKPGGTAGKYGDEWDFSAAYAAGAVSASFAIDEADATTIIVDYDLGGGASAFAAMHDKPAVGGVEGNDLVAMGLNFAF